MISFLKQLEIDEVSSVRQSANPGARILLMKRDGDAPLSEEAHIRKRWNRNFVALRKRAAAQAETPEEALLANIEAGLADDDVVDKGEWIGRQLEAYRDHVGKRSVAIRKGERDVDLSTETLVGIAKGVIEGGAPAVYPKSTFIAALRKRATAIRAAGETEAKAMTRAMTEDEIGKTLWRASKAASGPEVEPWLVPGQSETEVKPWGNSGPPKPSYFGPAHAKMQVLADDHHKANPRLTKDGAYARVYSDPANHDLREQVKAEHFAAIAKVA